MRRKGHTGFGGFDFGFSSTTNVGCAISIAGPTKRGVAVRDVSSKAPFDVSGICGITLGSCHKGNNKSLLALKTKVSGRSLTGHVVFTASGSLHCCLVRCVRRRGILRPRTVRR